MLYLNPADTRSALGMTDAIAAMRQAFTGDSETPLRSLLGGSLVMPGRLDETMAVKVVSIVPGNPAGLVVVFAGDGSPLGVVDGPTLTSIRTGAVCGLASELLADRSVSTLAMLGAGAMAFDQVEAIKAVRPIERVLVWSRSFDKASFLAERVGGEPIENADEAVSQADIVSCATPAVKPLFSEGSVREGVHVNAVGAFTPEMIELPGGLVSSAYVVVDEREAAAAEAGDLIQVGREPDATLAELLSEGTRPAPSQTTVFKSVGVAAQDVAAGAMALQKAADVGIGTLLS